METWSWNLFVVLSFAVAKEVKDARNPFLEKLPDWPDLT